MKVACDRGLPNWSLIPSERSEEQFNWSVDNINEKELTAEWLNFIKNRKNGRYLRLIPNSFAHL